MARRRLKPCDFCAETTFSDYKEHRNGYCLWYESYPFNNLFSVICQANDEEGEVIEDSINIEMNFCPVCGRDLRDSIGE